MNIGIYKMVAVVSFLVAVDFKDVRATPLNVRDIG